MTITLTREVNYEMLTKLTSFIPTKTNKLIIYFSSNGGYVDSADAIIDYININKSNIEFIGFGSLKSAAFKIFFSIKCNKRLLPYTTGMAHLSYTSISISETGVPIDGDKFDLKELKEARQETINFYTSINLNKQELKKINAGGDVYFSTSRMKELCQKQM